jgi:hypothetical protein
VIGGNSDAPPDGHRISHDERSRNHP